MDESNEEWLPISDDEFCYYMRLFHELGPVEGFLSGDSVRDFFLQSRLSLLVLSQIWNLADETLDNLLDVREFMSAAHLCCGKVQGRKLPQALPHSLPPDVRNVDVPVICKASLTEFKEAFKKLCNEGANFVGILNSFNVTQDKLQRLWRLSATKADQRLRMPEFAIFSHLVQLIGQGFDLKNANFNVSALLPGYKPPANTPAGNRIRLKLIQERVASLQTCQNEVSGNIDCEDVSSQRCNSESVKEEIRLLHAEEAELKRDIDTLDNYIASLSERTFTRATKDLDPFHQLHEQRKEERKNGIKPTEIHLFPNNPFDLTRERERWQAREAILAQVNSCMESTVEKDVWTSVVPWDVCLSDESAGFDDDFLDVLHSPDDPSALTLGRIVPEFTVDEDEAARSSPVFKTVPVTAEEDELWCSIDGVGSGYPGPVHRRNLSIIDECFDNKDTSPEQTSDRPAEDNIPDIISGLDNESARPDTVVDIISNITSTKDACQEKRNKNSVTDEAAGGRRLGYISLENSDTNSDLSESSPQLGGCVSPICTRPPLTQDDSFEELSYVLHKTPSPRIGVPFELTSPVHLPVPKNLSLDKEETKNRYNQCNENRSTGRFSVKTLKLSAMMDNHQPQSPKLSFNTQTEQGLSSRKLDLENKRAQFFGYQLRSESIADSQEEPARTGEGGGDEYCAEGEPPGETVILPEKASRHFTFPQEFVSMDTSENAPEDGLNSNDSNQDFIIPPPVIPEPLSEINCENDLACEEEIIPQTQERKVDVSDLFASVVNANAFIQLTQNAVKQSHIPEDQQSLDSDISDDEGNNTQASFTPGEDVLNTCEDSDTDSGNVTLISHHSLQMEDTDIAEMSLPPPAEFDESPVECISPPSTFVRSEPNNVCVQLENKLREMEREAENEDDDDYDDDDDDDDDDDGEHGSETSFSPPVDLVAPPVIFSGETGKEFTDPVCSPDISPVELISETVMDQSISELSETVSPPEQFGKSDNMESVETSHPGNAVISLPHEEFSNSTQRETSPPKKAVSFQNNVEEISPTQPAFLSRRLAISSRYAILSAPKGWGKKLSELSIDEPTQSSREVMVEPSTIDGSRSGGLESSASMKIMEAPVQSDNSGNNATVSSTLRPTPTPAFNRVMLQKQLASSADMKRAMAVAESVTETSFLGNDSPAHPVPVDTAPNDESQLGVSLEPDQLEQDRRSLIKQMRVKRKGKLTDQWTSQDGGDSGIAVTEPPGGLNVNNSRKMFEERKKTTQDKMPSVGKKMTQTTAPLIEKERKLDSVKGEVDNTSLQDVRTATKYLWEERARIQEPAYNAPSGKAVVIGKIWDKDPLEMDTNRLSYECMPAKSIDQLDNKEHEVLITSQYLVAPPSGFGDSSVQDSSLVKEDIQLTKEREKLVVKSDVEKSVVDFDIIEGEKETPMADLSVSIIEQEIRKQEMREKEWLKGHVLEQTPSKEQTVLMEAEKEEDTANESIIEREIRLQAEKEARMRQEHLRLNLPVGSIGQDDDSSSVAEFYEVPPPVIQHQAVIKMQSGSVQRQGENRIARELREAEERELEFQRMKEQMQTQKSSLDAYAATDISSNRPKGIPRVPSSDKSSTSSSTSTSSTGYKSYQSPASTPRSEQPHILPAVSADLPNPFKRSTSQDSMLSSASSTSSSILSDNVPVKRVPKVKPFEDPEEQMVHETTRRETPIEREIRLAKEREEEYRLARGISGKNVSDDMFAEGENDPKPTTPVKTDSTLMKKLSSSCVVKDGENKRREIDFLSQKPLSPVVTTYGKFPQATSTSKPKSDDPVKLNRVTSVEKNIEIQEANQFSADQVVKTGDPPPMKAEATRNSINRPLTEEEREGFSKGHKFVMRQSSFKAESRIQQEIRELKEREEELKKQKDVKVPQPVTVSANTEPTRKSVPNTDSVDGPATEPTKKPTVVLRSANPLASGSDRAKRRSLLAERWQQRLQEGPQDGEK